MYQKMYQRPAGIQTRPSSSLGEKNALPSIRKIQERISSSSWRRIGGFPTVILVISGLVIGFLMGYDQSAKNDSLPELDKIMVDTNSGIIRYGPGRTPLELLGIVRKTRQTLTQTLQEEYGDYAGLLMNGANLGTVFPMSEGSKLRYQRRIVQKLLQKQLEPEKTVTFTWVTAGDVRASGFGNYPDHSYTSVLERTVTDAFQAVGIQFVAKNRAVYSAATGPTMALCMEKIYGLDIDVLSWDFSLSDGEVDYRAGLWSTRAVMHPSRPLLMMLDASDTNRWKNFFSVEGKIGVASLDVRQLASQDMPDSTRITHPEQLPKALQYLQCNGSIEGHHNCNEESVHNICNDEKGEICRGNKFFDNENCEMVQYQSDWNCGWKEHRLKGRLFGLLLIHLLQDALLDLDRAMNEISHLPVEKRHQLIASLYNQLDDQDKFVMSNSSPSPDVLGPYGNDLLDLAVPLLQRKAACFVPGSVLYRRKLGAKAIENSASCEKLAFPNDDAIASVKEELDPILVDLQAQGTVFLVACVEICLADKCVKAFESIGSKELFDDHVLITVDSLPAISFKKIDSCFFLQGVDGVSLWNMKGDKFRISVQAKGKEATLKLNSLFALST
mmetsp:Transcript_27524/g.40664  ORF Transcript_27524/g.40664 Transcript_27524/m.40664 type:complete len:613 (-) Transcript_27524:109-1947(-)|eukprot:CAMPEP_0194216990 /NCGR_PEP_ID=MMETSP0156-20130528/20122_1 /TAXON_ID=33649 /ORGANISM="Thalassionema nitzschioides, Strain L26-B" /LENGTH=612 /DNA_ID=CAMNT_0038945895 /DNA_START=58 /DNA_END=1896 /DNA_ORIENTATION=+